MAAQATAKVRAAHPEADRDAGPRQDPYARLWQLRAERDACTSLREFGELSREIEEETQILMAQPRWSPGVESVRPGGPV